MAKPIVHFISEPPLKLDCNTNSIVRLEVRPRSAGKCIVALITEHQACTFDNGQKKLSIVIESQAPDEHILCEIPTRMRVSNPDQYFIQISAHAVNIDGDKSFTKHIEAEVDGMSAPNDPAEDNDEQPIATARVIGNNGDPSPGDVIAIDTNVDVDISTDSDTDNPVT